MHQTISKVTAWDSTCPLFRADHICCPWVLDILESVQKDFIEKSRTNNYFPHQLLPLPHLQLTLFFFTPLCWNCYRTVEPLIMGCPSAFLLSFPHRLDDVKDIKQLLISTQQPAAPRAHLVNNYHYRPAHRPFLQRYINEGMRSPLQIEDFCL